MLNLDAIRNRKLKFISNRSINNLHNFSTKKGSVSNKSKYYDSYATLYLEINHGMHHKLLIIINKGSPTHSLIFHEIC